jgi:hypothetical protein
MVSRDDLYTLSEARHNVVLNAGTSRTGKTPVLTANRRNE